MFVELHILQNFAPSNLNRDDTGAPKDREFGGYRRARISSQCLKRAVRTAFRAEHLLPEENLAARTKRVIDELAKRLGERGKSEEEAGPILEALLKGVGLSVDNAGRTQYLLFLGEAEIAAVADLCLKNWDTLKPLAGEGAASNDEQDSPRARGSARSVKKAGKDAVPREIAEALRKMLNGGKAADLALFGRMLADLPENNVDAASQVAHALSTNKVSVEFDFYTAVDDLKPEDTAGADMLGTVEFNSACFYRYANVDVSQLERNLQGDKELARDTLSAFLRASVAAVPTGKQNSMAAQNPPSLVFAVVREAGLWSLANAFVKPVYPSQDADLVQRSIKELDACWGKLAMMYGEKGILGKWVASTEREGLLQLAGSRVGNIDQLVDSVLETAAAGATGAGVAR